MFAIIIMLPQSLTLEALKADLVSEMEIEQLFQKHIVDGTSYFFSENIKDINKEYVLRHELAQLLNLSINDIVIVGSAKLGFSVKDEKFLRFDERFIATNKKKNRSDIDIAIVSRKLFESQTELIFNICDHFDGIWEYQNWRYNLYYPDEQTLRQKGGHSLLQKYVMNLARGWFRVDYSPSIYINSAPWKKLVRKWSDALDRQIAIAIYSDWRYLKHYQMKNLETLRIKTRRLEI